MAAITSQNVAQAIVKLVASKGLPAVMGAMTMGNLVNRDYESTLANAGDTVNVPIPPTMVANNIVEGGSVQTQNPSLGNAQIVLNTHAESTFTIPDITSCLVGADSGNFDLLTKYMNPAMISIAEKIEADLLALATNFTANAAVGAYNTAILESVVDQAEQSLFDAKVPTSEPKSLVVSSSTYSTLRQLDRFTQSNTRGDGQAIVTGKVGEIKGFDVYRSQFVAKSGSNTTNIAFARDAIGLVIRKLPKPLPGTGAVAEYGEIGSFGLRVVMSYAPLTLAQQFTVDVLYGCAVLRNIYGVPVLS